MTTPAPAPIGGFWLALASGSWCRSHDREHAIGRAIADCGRLDHLQVLRLPDSDDAWDIFTDGRVTWDETRPPKPGSPAWGEHPPEDKRADVLQAFRETLDKAQRLAAVLELDTMADDLADLELRSWDQ